MSRIPELGRWLPKPWFLDLLALSGVLAVYGTLSLPRLDLPGLYYDEAVDAVPAMQLLQSQPLELVRNAGVTVAGRTLPLMAMDYVGAVHTYAALPFFALLGVGTVPLRLMTVAGGALTLILTYGLGQSLFSRPVGLAAALLLAVHPSFLFYVRQGVHVSSLLAVCATGSLFALWRWWTGRRPIWLVLGMLLLGLGLTTKILFVWLINALLAAFVLRLGIGVAGWVGAGFKPVATTAPSLRGCLETGHPGSAGASPARAALAGEAPALPGRLPPSSGQVPLAQVFGHPPGAGFVLTSIRAGVGALAGALAFLIGAGPLLLYNMKTGGTLQVLAENRGITQSGVDNSAYFSNLLTRLETLRVLLDGGHFWFLGGLFSFGPYPWIFLALCGVLPVLLWLNRDRHPRFAGGAGLLAFLLILVVLQSAVTVAGIWPTHLFSVMPVFMLLAAAALVLLSRWRVGKAAAVGLALVLLAGSVAVDLQYHRALAETGGRRAHSDAVARLATYLDQRADRAPFAMDWGIKASVLLLTEGRVAPQEIFFYSPEPPPLFTDWLYGAMHGPVPHRFIFHAADSTVFPRLPYFLELAAKWEREAVLEATIKERDGTPVYLVYAVR